jgi:hypothetical protein
LGKAPTRQSHRAVPQPSRSGFSPQWLHLADDGAALALALDDHPGAACGLSLEVRLTSFRFLGPSAFLRGPACLMLLLAPPCGAKGCALEVKRRAHARTQHTPKTGVRTPECRAGPPSHALQRPVGKSWFNKVVLSYCIAEIHDSTVSGIMKERGAMGKNPTLGDSRACDNQHGYDCSYLVRCTCIKCRAGQPASSLPTGQVLRGSGLGCVSVAGVLEGVGYAA